MQMTLIMLMNAWMLLLLLLLLLCWKTRLRFHHHAAGGLHLVIHQTGLCSNYLCGRQ